MKQVIRHTTTLEFKEGSKHALENTLENEGSNNSPMDAYPQVIQDIHDYLTQRNATFSDLKNVDIRLKNELQHILSEEELFFYDLLGKTAEGFKDSETRKKYSGKNWNFAICDTPIQKKRGIFFGLNWGGDDINQQTIYPPKNKDRNWNFISRIRPYFRDYFKQEIEDLNYSNLCFFRSPDMKHFVSADWERAIPLFKEYTEYIDPPWMLMFGAPPATMSTNHITDFKRIDYEGETKYSYGYTGILFKKYPFGSVPHPQSQISNEARNYLWQEVSKSLLT